ncbi:universal stress protein [Patiriisocius marinus]|uniref:Universal stress protein UspA n=1 Tax=Patiriisocius marinus TaxID=1397112 RepID=A0A5J4J2P7_9FLAO|nr:universal stress protein [Patiriisocius marinus]GER60051.1 universal stress protein UspA [Patiriisocius marinus]
MKTIIIPTDFSKNAYSAFFYATQLFAAEKCKFIIIHSFESQVTNLTSRIDIGKTEAIVTELYDTTETKCEEIKHKIILDCDNKNHSYDTIATSLTLSSAINKLIVKESGDYVVMGSKGSTAARDILMGSNTLSMIQKIKNAPLLIIPQELDFTPVKHIAFATGFKRAYSKKELQPLVAISSLNNADIKVVHVNERENMSEAQQTNFKQLFKLLKSEKPENTLLLDEGETFDAISYYLSTEDIDMVSMILYKHNAIVRLFREATIKNIARYAEIPFLILPKVD